MKIYLIRTCDNKDRYYTLEIVPTLFSDFLLIIEYGAVNNNKPTGVVKKYFSIYMKAMDELNSTLNKKLKKGYRNKRQGN